MTTSWAPKVAGDLQHKVAYTVRRVDSNNQLERSIITTLFEVEDLQQPLLKTFCITNQIGHINNVRPISKMGTQQRQDPIIVEVQFDQADDITKAVTIGVIHKERCYKGTPTNVGTSNTLVKLLLNNVPWSAGLNATDFAHQMVESLGHYGRVCQLRKHTCAGGFFEGEVSALLDVSDTEVSYLSLGRNVYLDWCDRYVSASFKGAPVVCHYCRKSGHLKKDCPSRPPLICFKCHQHGHIRRRCTAKELSTSEALDAYIRDTAQRRKPVPSTPNVPAGKPVPSAADRSHQPLPAAPVGGSMQTAAAPVPAANSENSQQDTPLNGGVQDSEHEDADVVLDEVTKQIEKEDEVMQEDEVRQAPLPAFRPQGSSNSKFAPVSIASQIVIDSNTTNPPSDSLQKEFASYLSSPTLNFDILCIQELTAYHRQSSLTPQQIQSFKYLFPKATDYIVNKHCGIFCFNRNINLVNHIYQPDGRFIIAPATAAATDTIICHIANVYAPASATENTVFLNQLPEDEPFAAISSSDPWLFMGDLNDKHLINSFRPLSSTSARPSPGHTPAIQFTAWLSSGFTNQFPRGATTFYRPGTARSTLDFLLGAIMIVSLWICYLRVKIWAQAPGVSTLCTWTLITSVNFWLALSWRFTLGQL
ncbi:hypothetical protein G6F42_019002 [Rhizopus arrhizus]|nr:hypothetical protein G6F42_019002 [Rhizopus arrhizus]